jgi:hypothetical protein
LVNLPFGPGFPEGSDDQMKITIEPTGPKSASVVCRNAERNGIKYLRLHCPIEWATEDEKPKQMERAKGLILKKINEN